MRYERDGKEVWITYNGEIYNYKEVRQQLVTMSYRFTTQSDIESLWRVILLELWLETWIYEIKAS